jgi:hypothetical protein
MATKNRPARQRKGQGARVGTSTPQQPGPIAIQVSFSRDLRHQTGSRVACGPLILAISAAVTAILDAPSGIAPVIAPVGVSCLPAAAAP